MRHGIAVNGGIGEGGHVARRHDVLGEDPTQRPMGGDRFGFGNRRQPLQNEGHRLVVPEPVTVMQKAIIEDAPPGVHRGSSSMRAMTKAVIASISSRPKTGISAPATGPLAAIAMTVPSALSSGG